jgi:hypothetical protein
MFSTKIGKNRPKCDHNIDPWLFIVLESNFNIQTGQVLEHWLPQVERELHMYCLV